MKYFLMLVGVVGMFLLVSPKAVADERLPNILLIVFDDLGFSDLGCYGGEIETPHIDSLAQNGLRFTQFYNTTRCWPTRSALMTGYYPQQIRSDPPRGRLPKGTLLVPHYLKPRGYKSYHSGKWHVPGAPLPCKDGGFDRSYVFHDHDRNFYPQKHDLDDKPLPSIDKENNDGYYSTNFIAQKMIEFLQGHAVENSDAPFFAFTAFVAPHFPLQAPQNVIDKYRKIYPGGGWDVVRHQRFERLTNMGIINTPLSPPDYAIGPAYGYNLKLLGPGEVAYPFPWESLNEIQKKFQTEKMAIYAAMVDCVDQATGRIVDELKKSGLFEDTIIFVFSDNGSSPELIVRGDGHDKSAVPGSGASFLCIGGGWATVSNTPFRLHKVWTHEGGTSTPLVVHWPKGIPKTMHNGLRWEPGHVIDILPTILDMTGTSAMNDSGIPLAGKSLLATLKSEHAEPTETSLQREFYFEHEGNRGFRSGNFKIVSAATTRQGDGLWRLYDLSTDRAETNDLSEKLPAKRQELIDKWEATDKQFARDSQRP